MLRDIFEEAGDKEVLDHITKSLLSLKGGKSALREFGNTTTLNRRSVAFGKPNIAFVQSGGIGPTVNIGQKPGQVDIEVIIQMDANDPDRHKLIVRTNDQFRWDAPMGVSSPDADSCGATALGPGSTEVVVEWDGRILKRQSLTISGEGPVLTAKYEVK